MIDIIIAVFLIVGFFLSLLLTKVIMKEFEFHYFAYAMSIIFIFLCALVITSYIDARQITTQNVDVVLQICIFESQQECNELASTASLNAYSAGSNTRYYPVSLRYQFETNYGSVFFVGFLFGILALYLKEKYIV